MSPLGPQRNTCCPDFTLDIPSGTGPCPNVTGGSFVSYATGTMGDDYPVVSATAANGFGIDLSLYYSSSLADGEKGTVNTVMGFGWSHSYNTYLFEQSRDLFKQSPAGRVTRYKRSGRRGNYAYTAQRGHQQTVTANPDGSFDIRNNDGLTHHFEKIPGNPLRVAGQEPWMLKRIEDRNGNRVDLVYLGSGLLDYAEASLDGRSGKRRVSFEYDAENRLWKITDPVGRVTTLGYDASGNLASITDPTGAQVVYSYNSRHQVTTKTDRNGRSWQYRYDGAGHPVGITDAAGKALFTLSNSQQWQTDSTELFRNKERVYIPGVTTRTDGNLQDWEYEYDANGLITRMKTPNDPANGDADGATTLYRYDPQTLNLARQEDDNHHVTEYVYDSHGNLTLERDHKGHETEYDYYPSGGFAIPLHDRVQRITYPNGSITEYTYDTDGNRLSETRDQGGLNLVTAWTYYPDGNVHTETDPNNHTKSYEYDDYGNLAKISDAEGYVTQFRYDKTGVPDYEALGNRTRMVDGNGHETAYEYDDLDRMTSETDPLGFVTNTFYDPEGNRTAVQRQVDMASPDVDWQLSTFMYDERDRLVTETMDPAGDPRNVHPAPLDLVTRYRYDGNDNRLTSVDPRNHTTRFGYDAQNRVVKVTDALNFVSETRYDGVGNRICQIDANGHYSTYGYDPLNRLEREVRKLGSNQDCDSSADGDDIVTRNFYDSGAAMPCDHDAGSPQCDGPMPGGGNIAYMIDPEGKYTHYKYDKVDRRWITIRKVGDTADSCDPAADPNQQDWCEYTKYDKADNVVVRLDANGNRTDMAYYDNDWLETETRDPGGLDLITSCTYDGAGNKKTVTTPRGNLITYSYDGRDQVVLVEDIVELPNPPLDLVAAYAYDGIGNRVRECDGNNHCTGYSYDAVNRLIDIVDPMGETALNGYDPNGNLIKATDREGHVTCHEYDAINRRTRTIQNAGDTDCSADADDITTDTDYDKVGNVVQLMDGKGNATAYAYDEADRLILETYADDTTRHFSYDKAGNLTDRIDQIGQVTLYVYDDLYRLTLRDYQDPLEPDDRFEYDIGGRMTGATKDYPAADPRPDRVVTFDGYDAVNRLLQTTQDAIGIPMVVGYSYDTPNGLHDIVYPGGRYCLEQMDLRERLVDVTCDSFNAQYAYDLGNRVETRDYNNGVTAIYGYNANDWIVGLVHDSAGGEIADFHYDYDKEGNKKYEEKTPAALSDRSELYGYDDFYRLIDYKVGNLDLTDPGDPQIPVPVTQTRYELDKAGNWDQFTVDADGAGPGVPVVYNNTPNRMNEYDDWSTDGPGEIPDDLGLDIDFADPQPTPPEDGENWAHDKNGNRREDGKRVYEYDDENRLIRVTRKIDGVVTEYRYDALGRRVMKIVDVSGPTPVVTRYAYDDARVIEEQDALGATLATYVYGNYIDEVLSMQRGGDDFYYHQNALWSVAAVTDAFTNVVERYAYTDYGCPTITDGAGGLCHRMPGGPCIVRSGIRICSPGDGGMRIRGSITTGLGIMTVRRGGFCKGIRWGMWMG